MTFDHTKIKFGSHVQEHVKTVEGHAVILLGVMPVNGRDVIVGTVKTSDRDWVPLWQLDGRCNMSANYNLIMTRPKRKLAGWLNVYPDGVAIFSPCPSVNVEALNVPSKHLVARVYHEIEFEEGEGL